MQCHYPSHSIDQLAEVVRHHIESASKIQHELVLSCNDFYLDGDLRVLASPSPPPRPPPREKATDSTLTILQLQDFYNQMLKVAPSGQENHYSSVGARQEGLGHRGRKKGLGHCTAPLLTAILAAIVCR